MEQMRRRSANRELDFPHGILSPGLIDLHAHPGWGDSKHDVDPDRWLLARGTTTAMSQGDAGAANWPAYRDAVIDAARLRIKLAMHLALPGESAPHPSYSKLDDLDVGRLCPPPFATAGITSGASRSPQTSWSPATSTHAKSWPAASRPPRPSTAPSSTARTPHPDWPLDEQLECPAPGRRGDLLLPDWAGLHRERRSNPGLRPRSARPRRAVRHRARDETSFGYEVAEAALADGFPPDTISTDIQRRHMGANPVHDLPLVMSKAAGGGHAGSRDLAPRDRTTGADSWDGR